jgi:hypothetical protein
VEGRVVNIATVTLRKMLFGKDELPPEYAPLKACQLAFSLSRTELLDLSKTKKIRSIHYRREGSTKGVWLIHLQSLRDYLKLKEE